MISEESQELIRKQFASLPKKIQEVILESNWEQTVRRIATRNNLSIGDGGALENEVFLTMLGISDPSEFIDNILEDTDLRPDQAEKIMGEVNREIFQTIREALTNEKPEWQQEFESSEAPKKAAINLEDNLEEQEAIHRDNEINPRRIKGISIESADKARPHVSRLDMPKVKRQKEEKGPSVQVENLIVKKMNAPSTAKKETYVIGDIDSVSGKSYPERSDPYREPIE